MQGTGRVRWYGTVPALAVPVPVAVAVAAVSFAIAAFRLGAARGALLLDLLLELLAVLAHRQVAQVHAAEQVLLHSRRRVVLDLERAAHFAHLELLRLVLLFTF